MKAVEVRPKGSERTIFVNPDAVASISTVEPRPTPEDEKPEPYSVIELTSGTRYEVLDDGKKLRKAFFG